MEIHLAILLHLLVLINQLALYVHPTNYKTDLASRLRQTANGKRQAEISRLPKTREIYFGFSLYFAC